MEKKLQKKTNGPDSANMAVQRELGIKKTEGGCQRSIGEVIRFFLAGFDFALELRHGRCVVLFVLFVFFGAKAMPVRALHALFCHINHLFSRV